MEVKKIFVLILSKNNCTLKKLQTLCIILSDEKNNIYKFKEGIRPLLYTILLKFY